MIYGKQIAIDNKPVDVASFMVSVDNESKIELKQNTAINGGKPGRRYRKKNAK